MQRTQLGFLNARGPLQQISGGREVTGIGCVSCCLEDILNVL